MFLSAMSPNCFRSTTLVITISTKQNDAFLRPSFVHSRPVWSASAKTIFCRFQEVRIQFERVGAPPILLRNLSDFYAGSEMDQELVKRLRSKTGSFHFLSLRRNLLYGSVLAPSVFVGKAQFHYRFAGSYITRSRLLAIWTMSTSGVCAPAK